MRKCRADRAAVRRIALACGVPLLLAGCARVLPPYGGEWRNHPPAIVGEWVDVQKVTATDSSIWVLDENGRDDLLRISADTTSSRTRYGYWYASSSDAGMSLCVTRRPGRDPATCTPLAAEVDSTVTPPRRRLVLRRYHGEHSLGRRVLVERR